MESEQEPAPRSTEAVRRALKALEQSGKLTAEDVVLAARDPESALHGCFEWDDSKAAEHWRLQQARSLIRSVMVKVTVEDDRVISVPIYVRDPEKESEQQGYVSLPSIMSNPAASKAALYVELVRIEGLLERAENIATACGLIDEVRKVKGRVKALRRRVEPMAATA